MANVRDMPGPEGSPFLRVERLTTSFSTQRGRLHAVDDVSFELPASGSLGVVGESGSGKSMLARSIMNLLPPGARLDGRSRVLLDGSDIRERHGAGLRHLWGREIAMVFQDPMTSLNPVRTVGKQLTDPIRYHLGLSRPAARARAAELLGQVGIGESERRLKQYPHELSGGMRQRVMIAIALSCSPRLLIADEPTTALDVTVQRDVLNLITGLRAELGMAMILISHDLDVVAGRTDHTMVMYAGRVVETGPTATLFSRTRHPYTEALLAATPRLHQTSGTRSPTIPGLAPDLAALPAGCSFAPRCRYAQDRCLLERPTLAPAQPGPAGEAPASGTEHAAACFYPTGTEQGRRALELNEARGRTAAGVVLAAFGTAPVQEQPA